MLASFITIFASWLTLLDFEQLFSQPLQYHKWHISGMRGGGGGGVSKQPWTHNIPHHPCTVALPGLGNWSAFSRVRFANPVKSCLRYWGQWRVLDGRYGSEIDPSVSEMSLKPSRHV